LGQTDTASAVGRLTACPESKIRLTFRYSYWSREMLQ